MHWLKPAAEALGDPESLYLRLNGTASTILTDSIYWQTVGSLAHAFASAFGVMLTNSVVAMNVPMMAAKTYLFMTLLQDRCSLFEADDVRKFGVLTMPEHESISVQLNRQ